VGRQLRKVVDNSPKPSLTITNFSVHAISQTRICTFTSRQSCPQGPPRGDRARLARLEVADVRAAVMASKSGARAAAAAFCWSMEGLSWTAAVVLSGVYVVVSWVHCEWERARGSG
jgi:hypothetical protein